MQVRLARHTENLDRVVTFWRDELGLPEVGRFDDHDGYRGVMLDLPGTGAHLELTAGGHHAAPAAHPETLIVLYLGSWEVVRERASRLSAAPVAAANPYWDENGLTFEDPDGFRVVLAASSWQDEAIKVLLISGSSRDGSANTAVLKTAAALAPVGIETVLLSGIGDLPLFNPDDDAEGIDVHLAVAAMRAEVARADAILICTPEYAGALPAAMKNVLEWTIGDAGTYGKPVAWINASGPAAPTGGADAHDSLAKVLAYAGAEIVHDACARVPISRDLIDGDGLVGDEQTREQISASLGRLASHVAAAR